MQGASVNTDDIDTEHSLLRGRSPDIGEIRHEPWGRHAMFSDHDGNGWVLRQAPLGA